MQVDASTLRRLWPHAPQPLVDAVAARSAAVFEKHAITTPLRAAHFMAQISHESGGGTITEESLTYTHAERIAAVWPTRFTAASAQPYVRNPSKLACAVYDGRMGNGAAPSTDGYDYRGRGLLQITGRDSYREIGALCGLPLEDKPELAYAPTTTLEVAAAEFQKLGCLPFCDQDNVKAVTRRVNGGYTGLADRQDWLARWKEIPFGGMLEHAVGADRAPEPAETAPAVAENAPPPPPPSLPRGSDEVLPPGVETPGKTMTTSKTGGAAVTVGAGGVIATVQAAHEAAGPLKDAKQDLQDLGIFDWLIAYAHSPAFLAGLVIVAAAAFIWFDRRKRLQADHV
jgi:putative chitinase